jgi:hypothetical protein
MLAGLRGKGRRRDRLQMECGQYSQVEHQVHDPFALLWILHDREKAGEYHANKLHRPDRAGFRTCRLGCASMMSA